ncbi:hypothetical protein [Parapedobacter tibetensis]|uniref:hypothetical protein n=1 Tax=Parapedobacter tibetensis TaxID=2972951 RepID=UPI00214DE535|nr:hypothetical protein [Parapedobacter tibetensis]
MGTTIENKGLKKKQYTEEERFALSLQSPAFVKKKKDAEAFLKKAGLPEWHPHYDKFKKQQ